MRILQQSPLLIPAPVEPPKVQIPLFVSRVCAGFTSPADEYIERDLDLNEYLVANPIATIFFFAKGESMRNANIFNGSVCVVDRSIVPRHGHIVLATVDGEFTVKRLYHVGATVELRPENVEFDAMCFKDGQEVQIIGVVRGTAYRFVV